MKILSELCIPQRLEVEMFGWTGTYQLDGLALPWCRYVRTDYTAGCKTPRLMFLRLGEICDCGHLKSDHDGNGECIICECSIFTPADQPYSQPTTKRPDVRFSTVDPDGLPAIEGEAAALSILGETLTTGDEDSPVSVGKVHQAAVEEEKKRFAQIIGTCDVTEDNMSDMPDLTEEQMTGPDPETGI